MFLNRAQKKALFEGLSSINKKDLIQVISFRMRYHTIWKNYNKELERVFYTLRNKTCVSILQCNGSSCQWRQDCHASLFSQEVKGAPLGTRSQVDNSKKICFFSFFKISSYHNFWQKYFFLTLLKCSTAFQEVQTQIWSYHNFRSDQCKQEMES